jgi:hypothetical protein
VTPLLRVLSLGAGVQSTTLALMAAHGEIEPMPDCAIFADTQAEPASVYEHLRWLMSPNVLPFPVHVVTAGDLRQHVIDAMSGTIRMDNRPPFFTASGGPLNRQCTTKHKIVPIRKAVLKLVGKLPPRGDPIVEQWLGISTDEAHRMKPARDWWQRNRWPLIEIGMTRRSCLGWLDRHGYPRPPKSSCTFCPFRSAEHWRLLRARDPEAFADAIAIDELIRPGLPREKHPQPLFVHHSLKPLSEVDFTTAAERGQPDLFGNECSGVCGV